MSEGLSHQDFIMTYLKEFLFGKTRDIPKKNGELTALVPYGKYQELILCPEPKEFLQEFNEAGNSKERCRAIFEEKMRTFRRIPLGQQSGFWWNTSRDQINLRLGINQNGKNPDAVPLGDITVHGLIAGQTGSGKSVLLHNLIFNLMAEYPPWELDLYLADFKRVEFSRYMDSGRFSAPHVVACAATGEIRYVLSLIQHLVDCMNAREDFFKRMGFEKIAKFRKAYPQVVLPRILLIVDEFQQMFLEASAKESEHIHRMLTAIVKKGRATGVHIVFASQEMSQTLSRSDLANFRLRIALNCDPNVSMDVLGNRKAAECPVGYVYVNNSDYSEATNMLFQVPLVETEPPRGSEDQLSYFETFMVIIDKMAKTSKIQKDTKFYQEDEQESIEVLEKTLSCISNYRRTIREKYFDALTLGRYVTFSSLRYDIQTLFIERGRNRNILAISPGVEDLAYLQRLFAMNFAKADFEDPRICYHHEIYSFMPAVESIYPLREELQTESTDKQPVSLYRNTEDFYNLEKRFTRMRFLLPLFLEAQTPFEFVLLNYQKNIEQELKRRPELRTDREAAIPVISQRFKDLDWKNVEDMCARIQEEEGRTILGKLAGNALEYCRFHENPLLVYPPTILWVVGIDVIERLPDWLLWMMKNGMDYNLLFLCMAGTDFDTMSQISKYCDYLFLGGRNRRIYDRLSVNYTAKNADCIALDMMIKSSGEERSFKKYRCSFSHHESPRIPFEKLL